MNIGMYIHIHTNICLYTQIYVYVSIQIKISAHALTHTYKYHSAKKTQTNSTVRLSRYTCISVYINMSVYIHITKFKCTHTPTHIRITFGRNTQTHSGMSVENVFCDVCGESGVCVVNVVYVWRMCSEHRSVMCMYMYIYIHTHECRKKMSCNTNGRCHV